MAKGTPSATCATCPHYHDDVAVRDFDGTCRINPPASQPHVLPMLTEPGGPPAFGVLSWSIFPPVQRGMWCGSHPDRRRP